MRLTTPQIASIINTVEHYCQGMNVELRLFGHQIQDYEQGNDLGLMLITENEDDLQAIEKEKVHMISAVVEKIGDMQIEVIITTREGLRFHPQAHDLLPESMFLHTYKK